MADVKLNFSSQWPTVQVARVISYPATGDGESVAYPYIKKYKHNLGYPPLAIGMSVPNGTSSYPCMQGLDVDDTYVYINDNPPGWAETDCAIVYALDISKEFKYSKFESKVGEVLEDTSGGKVDLRKFLLHSRAVGPMVLDVVTKDFKTGDLNLVYNSPLDYPTFSFGYIYWTNLWRSVPLAGQAYPVMPTDGYKSEIYALNPSDQQKGSIVILRNPAIITDNTVSVTL